mmetsp:Transcript_34929/g.6288  ORF Transcript_34929/g.6288 Transcript_34929/m.6288 type:complete len:88 (+) Transcript_34929:510-773(+)
MPIRIPLLRFPNIFLSKIEPSWYVIVWIAKTTPIVELDKAYFVRCKLNRHSTTVKDMLEKQAAKSPISMIGSCAIQIIPSPFLTCVA